MTWKAHGLSVGNSVQRLTQTTSLKLGAVGVWEQVNFTAPAGTVLLVDDCAIGGYFHICDGWIWDG